MKFDLSALDGAEASKQEAIGLESMKADGFAPDSFPLPAVSDVSIYGDMSAIYTICDTKAGNDTHTHPFLSPL